MPRLLPVLAKAGGGLAGQLDLDRDALRQGVDVLAVQASAGGVGVIRQLDRAVGDVPGALPAQLALADPAAPGRTP
jgi:hypothetical protein